MKKKTSLLKILILVLIILISTEITLAGFSYGSYFGGKIINTEAKEIEEKENNGYNCELSGGKSITINPIKGPDNYYIQPGSNQIISPGKWILGKYSGKKTITCKKQCGETECIETVDLNEVTLFRVSK